MAKFYRIYAFDTKDYKNKLKELDSMYKIVHVFPPEKNFNNYEIVYTDDFKKQEIAYAEAKRKKYYEDLFDRIFQEDH